MGLQEQVLQLIAETKAARTVYEQNAQQQRETAEIQGQQQTELELRLIAMQTPTATEPVAAQGMQSMTTRIAVLLDTPTETNNGIKTRYIRNYVTDAQLDRYVELGEITVEQAEKIRAIKVDTV